MACERVDARIGIHPNSQTYPSYSGCLHQQIYFIFVGSVYRRSLSTSGLFDILPSLKVWEFPNSRIPSVALQSDDHTLFLRCFDVLPKLETGAFIAL